MTRRDKIPDPTARITSPTRERDGTRILDIDRYPPFLLNAVSNAWGRKTSAIYRRDFGLGLVDWRVMAMLNIEPGITASRICDVVLLDKAAVSRSLKQMLQKGLLRFEQPSNDPRKRLWWLSEHGQTSHEAVLQVALACETDLVDGISPADLETFLNVIKMMLSNIDPK